MNSLLNLLIAGVINMFKTILKDLCNDIVKYIKQAEEIRKTIERNHPDIIMSVLFSLFEYTPTQKELAQFITNKSNAKFEYVLSKVVDNANKKFVNMLIKLFVYNIFNKKIGGKIK